MSRKPRIEPSGDVVARVRPLITRDNEWSFRERVPYYVVCAEVLRGLGIADGERVSFTLQSAAAIDAFEAAAPARGADTRSL